MTGVEIDDDGHDLTQTQLTLASALPLATVQQTLVVDGFKELAKIVDITEHGDELAHKDLSVWLRLHVTAQPPYDSPYELATPPGLSRIEVNVGSATPMQHCVPLYRITQNRRANRRAGEA